MLNTIGAAKVPAIKVRCFVLWQSAVRRKQVDFQANSLYL